MPNLTIGPFKHLWDQPFTVRPFIGYSYHMSHSYSEMDYTDIIVDSAIIIPTNITENINTIDFGLTFTQPIFIKNISKIAINYSVRYQVTFGSSNLVPDNNQYNYESKKIKGWWYFGGGGELFSIGLTYRITGRY